MKRQLVTAAVIPLAVLAVAVTGFHPFNATMSPPTALAQPAKRDRWEYAELSAKDGFNTKRFWEGSDGTRNTAETYKALAEKMKIKLTTDDATALLNALGEDGWELVSHIVSPADGYQAWTFKRKK